MAEVKSVLLSINNCEARFVRPERINDPFSEKGFWINGQAGKLIFGDTPEPGRWRLWAEPDPRGLYGVQVGDGEQSFFWLFVAGEQTTQICRTLVHRLNLKPGVLYSARVERMGK